MVAPRPDGSQPGLVLENSTAHTHVVCVSQDLGVLVTVVAGLNLPLHSVGVEKGVVMDLKVTVLVSVDLVEEEEEDSSRARRSLPPSTGVAVAAGLIFTYDEGIVTEREPVGLPKRLATGRCLYIYIGNKYKPMHSGGLGAVLKLAKVAVSRDWTWVPALHMAHFVHSLSLTYSFIRIS